MRGVCRVCRRLGGFGWRQTERVRAEDEDEGIVMSCMFTEWAMAKVLCCFDATSVLRGVFLLFGWVALAVLEGGRVE